MNQTTSDPSVEFFALPVALEFKNATQQKTVVLNNTFNGENFFENIGFVADSVTIDPDYWLITKNNTSEKVIDDAGGNNIVQVFPNPYTNSFNLYLRKFGITTAHIKIYDARGRLMLKKDLPLNQSLFYEVDTPGFAPGIYFIKIQTDNGVKFAKKILKQ